MRIVGGHYRGRKLVGPDSDSIRPTGDRIRESLFSILGELDGVTVIDAFAGTGALGCEAISRGAEHVHFFETSRRALKIVRENVAALDEQDRCTVWEGSAVRYRDKVAGAHLAFIDPPFAANAWSDTLTTLAPMMAPEGLCVCEHPTSVSFDIPAQYELDDRRTYGSTTLTFVRLVSSDCDNESNP